MSHLKSVVAVLVLFLTAIVGVVPQARAAASINLQLAGSSAMWQSTALAAYNSGSCLTGATAPCFHWTSGAKFNLVDTRPGAGNFITDTGNIWLVWDSTTPAPNVWAYISVDSVAGERCYFAQPHCVISVTTFPAAGNLISLPAPVWGTDTATASIPTAVTNLFTTGSGNSVNVAATVIRSEDALFATCRANSALGGGPDGLAGLGYGINPSGACPTTLDNAHLIGADIKSAYPGSTASAHIVAFNIGGKDPFTGKTIPAATTVSVGASPIVFIVERDHELAGVQNANDTGLQSVFSGANCNASEFGLSSNPIDAYLYEPISGTMNVAEANVFRYVFNIDSSGKSTEAGVGGTANNPLKGSCVGGSRFRSIATSEEVKSVLNSFTNNSHDGIGYAFFSYGNVSTIASNAKYGYLTLNGVDPLWHVYGVTGVDPGEPTNPGNLPGVADLPASCGGNFPCSEGVIWGANSKQTGTHGLSFPNLRNGSYRAWSVLRIVSDGTALTHAKVLATASQKYNVTTVPDYVPAIKTTAGGQTDPGLQLLRSHYQEVGGGVNIGPAPINLATTGDKGGDQGGCILPSNGLYNESDSVVQLAQSEPGSHCLVIP